MFSTVIQGLKTFARTIWVRQKDLYDKISFFLLTYWVVFLLISNVCCVVIFILFTAHYLWRCVIFMFIV